MTADGSSWPISLI